MRARDSSRRLLEWPNEQRFYLTIDFECDYGTALPENHYQAVTQVDRLIDILSDCDLPLTVFVQTEVLEQRPNTVDALQQAPFPIEFHPHSHTHANRSEASTAEEVRVSTEIFEDFSGSNRLAIDFRTGMFGLVTTNISQQRDTSSMQVFSPLGGRVISTTRPHQRHHISSKMPIF